MLTGREVLIYLSLKYEGDWESIYNAIKNKEPIEETKDINKKLLEGTNANIVTILDPEYPSELKRIRMCPFVLYYYGDFSLIQNVSKNVAFVGSRENSPYGAAITKEIIKGLKNKFNIVSGLARGIDSVAHKSAIDSGAKTIAVLGSGIDYCYPSENEEIYETIKKDHLLISEYPGMTKPEKEHFPIRNRLIAAFSNGVVVPEAKLKSGTMITINYAVESGKEVMCVPERANQESACNFLIKQGATLIETAEDVEYCLTSLRQN